MMDLLEIIFMIVPDSFFKDHFLRFLIMNKIELIFSFLILVEFITYSFFTKFFFNFFIVGEFFEVRI